MFIFAHDQFLSGGKPVAYDHVRDGQVRTLQAKGMLTDMVTLKERGLEVSCANISCGYYYLHTGHEFTGFEDLQKCLGFVRHIIQVYRHRKKVVKGKVHSFFEDRRYSFR